MQKLSRYFVSAIMLVVVGLGCSSRVPVADAGPDQSVQAGETVTLEGRGSGGTGSNLSFLWTQIGGTPVTLSNTTLDRPTFTAPSTAGIVTFALVVSDGRASSLPDQVSIVVQPADSGGNHPPVADAGLDQSVKAGESVTLEGRGSGGNGSTLSFLWTQIGGTPVTLSNTATDRPTFTAPSTAGTLTFELVVSDKRASSVPDRVSIVVLTDSGGNPPPVANAGPDQSVKAGESVTLEGRGSGGDGSTLSFLWTQISGTPVTLSNTTIDRPTFTAPSTAGTLTFALVVSDKRASSLPDQISIVVLAPPPVANAGPDQSVSSGRIVTLEGSGSGGDGSTLSFLWTQTGGTPVTLSNTATDRPTFTAPSTAGTLTFELVVSDKRASSVPDQVSIVVLPADPGGNHAPTASAGSDRTVFRRATVTIDGSGSDVDNDSLTYAWTQTSGPAVTLTGANSTRVSFTAPGTEAVLTFSLSVSDGELSASDDVTIRVQNRVPVISSVALSPSDAKTLDNLSFTFVASDADGDPLTTSYVWKRNGAVVAGEIRSTYPNTLTTKGDTITVTATVSDGITPVTAERNVVIQDTPLSLTAAGPLPTQTNHCSAVAFDLIASDPDGDPLGDFVVRHGPAGMSVSAAGKVTWDACLPLFDRSIDVSWSVGLSLHPAAKVTGALKVEDPSRQYVLRRTGIEIPVYHSGLQVTDLDGNSTQEMLIASRRVLYVLAGSGTAYAQSWVYPFAAPDGGEFLAVVARDIDGDGKQEIFFSSNQFVVKLDGVNRREVARYQTGTTYGCRDLEIADLSGDGDFELVCMGAPDYSSSGDRVVVFDPATLSVEWKTATGGFGLSLALGNVDADAAIEIVTAKGYVYDGATQANEWAYGPGFGSRVDTGDLDGDGIEEIVGMAEWDVVTGFSAVKKSPIWEVATFDSDALLVTDFEGDAKAEILVGDGQWGDVTAYRYEASNNTVPVIFTINSQDHGVSSIAVGDVDGDGKTEFVWGSGATSSGDDVFVIAGRNPTIAVEWTNTNPNQLDGPFVGGHYARLTSTSRQLLFGTVSTNSGYNGSRLISLDPVTGATRVSNEIGSNWDDAFAFTISDYDLDGVDEALVATSTTYDGYFTAYDFNRNTAEWTSAVGMGPAGAVVSGDVNGDGFPDFVAITTDGYVHVYDVVNKVLLWKSTSLGAGVDVELVDVDRDGVKEIVALAGGAVYIYGKDSSGPTPFVQKATRPVTESVDLLVADLDGDLAQELYVLQAPFSSPVTVHRFDGALAVGGTFPGPSGATSLHAEALGSGRRNLVIGVSTSGSSFTSTAAELRAVDARSGTEVWRSPPLPGKVSKNSVFFTDVGGTALPEIVFANQYGMNVTR